MALVPTVPWLFVTRALNGVSGASVTAASAYIADVTPPERRAAGFGVLGAAFGLGFVVGPLLGGVLGKIDVRLPFFVAGALALANFAFGLFVMPESLPPERRRAHPLANPFAGVLVLRRYTLAGRLAIALLFLHLAQFALHVTWALYTQYRFDWAMIVQGGLARRVIPALGERRALLLGAALIIAAYVGYGAATAGWMIYAAIAVQSLGGIAGPAAQAMISKSVSPQEQGIVQGSLTGVQGLANVVGPLLGGAVFTWSITAGRSEPLPGLVYFVCAALAAVGLAIAIVVLARTPHLGDPAPPRENAP
jgi:DHA1 family tetracycline resistance protein-like MFS transporter